MKQISQSKINLWYSLVPTSFYDSWIKNDEPDTGRKDLFNFMKGKGNSLIELGCGTGMNLKYLNEDTDFHGLDMNQHMLNSAKRRGKKLGKNLNFYLGDAKKTGFQNSFFDKGILTYALSGIPDGEAVLFELSRIVKDKGKIGILDFANIEPNFIGGVAGITSIDKLVEKPYLKLIEKKSYFMEYSPIYFMVHKLYLFENSKWEYILPEVWVQPGPQDWGGVSISKNEGKVNWMQKYMKEKHNMKTRVFKTAFEDIIHHKEWRIKTNKLLMFEELFF